MEHGVREVDLPAPAIPPASRNLSAVWPRNTPWGASSSSSSSNGSSSSSASVGGGTGGSGSLNVDARAVEGSGGLSSALRLTSPADQYQTPNTTREYENSNLPSSLGRSLSRHRLGTCSLHSTCISRQSKPSVVKARRSLEIRQMRSSVNVVMRLRRS